MVVLLSIASLGLIKKDNVPKYSQNELVGEFYSPINLKKISIYQGPDKDAVMVDNFVVGEMDDKIIYYKYHDQFESCYWNDEDNVVINGQIINVEDKDTWIYSE